MVMNKLLKEYEKLIDRLYKAEMWAIDNGLDWGDVEKYKPKIWEERRNIIKEIESIRETLSLHK
jgi:hypothetical protein